MTVKILLFFNFCTTKKATAWSENPKWVIQIFLNIAPKYFNYFLVEWTQENGEMGLMISECIDFCLCIYTYEVFNYITLLLKNPNIWFYWIHHTYTNVPQLSDKLPASGVVDYITLLFWCITSDKLNTCGVVNCIIFTICYLSSWHLVLLPA